MYNNCDTQKKYATSILICPVIGLIIIVIITISIIKGQRNCTHLEYRVRRA